MQDNWINMWSEGDCPDARTLMRYAHNQLKGADLRFVEEHLASCSFCSDALEGFIGADRTDKLETDLAELEKRMNNAYPVIQKKHGAGLSWLKIAAVLLLFVVSGLLIMYLADSGRKKSMLSEHIPSADHAAKYPGVTEPVHEEKSTRTDGMGEEAQQNKNDNEINRKDNKNATSSETLDKKSVPAVTKTTSPENSPTTEGPTPSEEGNNPAGNASAQAELQKHSSEQTASGVAVTMDETESGIRAAGEKEYISQSVKSGVGHGREAAMIPPDTLKLAKQFISENKFSDAIRLLEIFLRNKSMKQNDAETWELSNAYIGNNQDSLAVPLLKILEEDPGDYQLRARKLLNSIR